MIQRRKIFHFFICLIVSLLASCGKEQVSHRDNYYPLQIGDKVAWVEIAMSSKMRDQGLMYRHSLPKDCGMLFVYADSRRLSFWMKNTFMPLSIAFIRKDGTISEILDMTPTDGRPDFSLPSYKSREKVMYGLEMMQGWFEKQNIRPGMKVTFPLILKNLFKSDDFVNLSELIPLLMQRKDRISQYICDHFSPGVQQLLQNMDSTPPLPEDIEMMVIDELNQLLCMENLWEKDFIPAAWLTNQKLDPKADKTEQRVCRNRILLARAYPKQIRASYE